MEKHTFPLPEVSGELQKTIEARLHTDRDGPHLERILELQKRFTGTVAIPIYVIVDPKTEKKIATFQGATFQPSEFAGFVRKAVE